MQSWNLCPVENSDDFHTIDFILYVISETLQTIDHLLNIQNTPILFISFIPYIASITLQCIDQLNIQTTFIYLLSSLIWFLLPCNQLTDRTLDDFYTISFVLKMMYAIPQPIEHHLNIQTTSILLISFMPQCYFCHPATHWPVEHSYDFSIIACLHPLYYSTTH